MALWKDVTQAFISAGGNTAKDDLDQATLSRLAFWNEVLGEKDMVAITPEDIDTALLLLAERGRLRGGKMATTGTGQPMAGSTMNRYVSQAGSIFKYAKRKKLLPRAFVAPTRGVERHPERPDPDRYLRPEQVEAALSVARIIDRRWRKMTALIVLAFHTGLRVGSLLNARGRDLDLEARTLTIARTKNDEPIVVGLSTAALAQLKKLPKVGPDARIFGAKDGGVFNYRSLWNRIAKEARLEGHVFHELRHGHGTLLAKKGTSQQMIMKCMGHKTLSASARYAHANTEDKQAVIAHVFG